MTKIVKEIYDPETETFTVVSPPKKKRQPKYAAKRGRALKVVSDPMFGNKEFMPSALQMQFAQIYLKRLDMDMPIGKGLEISILENDLHRNIQNWYQWKKKPGFMKWFLALKENFHNTLGLANVHNATYTHAVKESPQDRKLYLERFDAQYKPQTSQNITFAGLRPIENVNEEDMRQQSERFRKQVESKVI